MIPHPKAVICLLRGWWWSFRYAAPIAGHDFVEIESPPKTQVLQCQTCGDISTGWYR